jgi:hypothetical protein
VNEASVGMKEDLKITSVEEERRTYPNPGETWVRSIR